MFTLSIAPNIKGSKKDFALCLIICLGLDAFIVLFAIGSCTSKQPVKIIEKVTDARGLTSVKYVKGKDTLALDYLTPRELDSLSK